MSENHIEVTEDDLRERIDALESELSAVKAELASCDKYAKEQYKSYDAEIDRLKASLDHQEKTHPGEVITIPSASWNRLIKDRDAWKARYEDQTNTLEKYRNQKACPNCGFPIEEKEEYCAVWKAKAEKMAEALRKIVLAGTVDQSKEQPGLCVYHSPECCVAKAALDEYEKGVEG